MNIPAQQRCLHPPRKITVWRYQRNIAAGFFQFVPHEEGNHFGFMIFIARFEQCDVHETLLHLTGLTRKCFLPAIGHIGWTHEFTGNPRARARRWPQNSYGISINAEVFDQLFQRVLGMLCGDSVPAWVIHDLVEPGEDDGTIFEMRDGPEQFACCRNGSG